jgi:hypothetical protein
VIVGSWVIDSTNGTWYGQIVAAKPETALAYIALARYIFRDIRDQFGGRHVRMPIESDFVSRAVSVIKRDLSRSSSTVQGSSQQDFAWSSNSSQNKKCDFNPTRKLSFRTPRSFRLIRRLTNSSVSRQENLTWSIEMQRKISVNELQTFKLLT